MSATYPARNGRRFYPARNGRRTDLAPSRDALHLHAEISGGASR
ncbi:MAG TPA: hypothetical protein VFP89_10570 [Propionibacteriaceae bacterium]|nr:hypothetical protein [Propionibacteriaceae bacterium]